MDKESVNFGVQDVELIKNLSRDIFSSGKKVKRESLMSIIKRMRNLPTPEKYVNCVNELSDNDLMGILNLVYRRNSASHFEKSEHPLLDASITLVFVRMLMKKWDGFQKLIIQKEASEKEIYEKLVKYLKINLNHIFVKKNEILDNFKRNDSNMELICENEKSEDENIAKTSTEEEKNVEKMEFIEVQCPYKQLKTLFLMDSVKSDTSILNECKEESSTEECNFQLAEFPFLCLFNWSYVGLTLFTPKYTIICKNVHGFDYKLIKLTHNYKPSFQRKVGGIELRKMESQNTILSSDLSAYIYSAIKISGNDISDVRHATKTVFCIDEVTTKIGKILKTNTVYTIASKDCYVRYLGQQKQFKLNGPIVNAGKQKCINESCDALNVRLQEVIYPILTFYIKENADETEYSHIKVDFSCSLCDLIFQGRGAELNLKRHLILEHGQEPDWFCTLCEESFSMKKLTMYKWAHTCPGKPGKISMGLVSNIITYSTPKGNNLLNIQKHV